MISQEEKFVDIQEKSLVIIIGKDQCSRCNSAMIELIEKAKESKRDALVIRIIDSSLMECKKDESFFREEFQDLSFEYISEKSLSLVNPQLKSKYVKVKTTPHLFILDGNLTSVKTERLIDDYGHLKYKAFN